MTIVQPARPAALRLRRLIPEQPGRMETNHFLPEQREGERKDLLKGLIRGGPEEKSQLVGAI